MIAIPSITKEHITNNPNISGYLAVPRVVEQTLEGRICNDSVLPFLSLLADIMREMFPERFTYLEIGTLFGGSMCAVRFHQKVSKYEKYAGVDLFTYYGEEKDPQSGKKVSIELADRNIRYFGGATLFALFEGDSINLALAARVLAYLRNGITMLYIDGGHTKQNVIDDFATYEEAVVPGGVVVFDDYHNNQWPGATEAIDDLDKEGWNVIGALAANVPTLYVMQKENDAG